METYTILVVEDEAVIGMNIRSTLKRLGYHVPPVVPSGEKAVQKAHSLKPDLILMDIMLKKGGIDGVQAAEKIGEDLEIPIVFLTAHSDPQTIERAKAAAPFGYIVKPFEERNLQTTVEIALVRAKAEFALKRAIEKERELNELKNRFVSIVSHEFRTPLSTILFSATLLENFDESWPAERRKDYFQKIHGSVKQLRSLIDDVLLLGQAESQKLDFKPLDLNLEKFCLDLLDELKLTECQERIQFVMTGDCHHGKLDRNLLTHILRNLLTNAAKYSPDGSTVDFELTCQDEWVIFRVQDRGIGIPLEDQKRLYETFHRAKNVGKIAGTGLGLSIVKQAVDLHKGTIDVKSQVGKGTEFVVKLPRV
ncbi:response regulator [Spirulina subsalsa FACHB-351]|uniref:histidine kinase n=1 Tax=Spirulina subsalsa FACHB-351 TaxID=234711 RepID=A0ABT3LBQ0_9CYAN|nr:ATP-binding protein [Spirulina subsalsa]MCW6038933.1 response regulator [Spirulina subsalsa FACHB-351]